MGNKLSVRPDTTTTYRVTGYNCKIPVTATVTIKVNTPPTIDLGADTTVCKESAYVLDAGEYASYKWHDNTADRYHSVDAGGRYSVQVSSEEGCTNFDDIWITLMQGPRIDLGDDQVICEAYRSLHAGGGYDSYLWSDGSTDSLLMPHDPGKYWVTVKNICGESADTITISSLEDLFIPNVVIPQGLLDNRKFRAVGMEGAWKCNLSVYDRWGNAVYQKSNYNDEWPPMNEEGDGVYYYRLEYPGCKTYKGWVQVIR